jgi:hypothetical protein
VRIEVTNLDAGELASPNAEEQKAEEGKAVAWMLCDRQEARPRVRR